MSVACETHVRGTGSDDLSSLRRCVRDLVALSGLTAAWNGREPPEIAGSLPEVLELRDFLENAAEGLHWAGPDGTILWANHAER